jgi:hypothetical protein
MSSPRDTLLDNIGSVTLYSGRGPTYCLEGSSPEHTLTAKPTGKRIWMYDIKPVACIDLKSKKACSQVFKRMTGFDMSKAPKPSLRRTCKCRKPVPMVVQDYTSKRYNGSGLRYFSCSKCGGFLKGISSCIKKKGRYD